MSAERRPRFSLVETDQFDFADQKPYSRSGERLLSLPVSFIWLQTNETPPSGQNSRQRLPRTRQERPTRGPSLFWKAWRGGCLDYYASSSSLCLDGVSIERGAGELGNSAMVDRGGRLFGGHRTLVIALFNEHSTPSTASWHLQLSSCRVTISAEPSRSPSPSPLSPLSNPATERLLQS